MGQNDKDQKDDSIHSRDEHDASHAPASDRASSGAEQGHGSVQSGEYEAHTDLPGGEDIERHPLAEEVGLLKEALLRTRAEMDNLHKRAERELEKSRKFALEGLLKDLVPVIDTLDQGIDAAGDQGAEGLKLTRKLMLDTLARHGLEVLDPTGERFDPQWHEAMSLQPSSEHAPDTVVAVLQRGYRLHERVVRPARVIVAREG